MSFIGMSDQEDSRFTGEFIERNGSRSLKSVPINPRQAWLRMTEGGYTKDYVVEVHIGRGFYGEGQSLSGKDVLLNEIGDGQYHFQLQKSNALPSSLRRIDRGVSLVPGSWVALYGDLKVQTFPLDAYDHVLTETAHTDASVIYSGRDRFIGAISSDGEGWSPDGRLTATMVNHGTMKLVAPHGSFYYENPTSFEHRASRFDYPQGF